MLWEVKFGSFIRASSFLFVPNDINITEMSDLLIENLMEFSSDLQNSFSLGPDHSLVAFHAKERGGVTNSGEIDEISIVNLIRNSWLG